MHRFRTKVTCPARETADKASCSKTPSMSASDALTIAVIRFWKASGMTMESRFRLNALRSSSLPMSAAAVFMIEAIKSFMTIPLLLYALLSLSCTP